MNADEIIAEFKRRLESGDDLKASFKWYTEKMDSFERGLERDRLYFWMDGAVFMAHIDIKEVMHIYKTGGGTITGGGPGR